MQTHLGAATLPQKHIGACDVRLGNSCNSGCDPCCEGLDPY